MAEFLDFISRMAICLQISKIRYVVVGGLAAIIRGRTRTTQDIDLIIEKQPQKIHQFIDQLKKYDFEILEDQIELGIKEGFQISIFDIKSALRLDLKIAGNDEDDIALDQKVVETYQGISLNLVSIEQFLIGKIMYLGDISDIEEDKELLQYNDVLDFLTIYQLYNTTINLEYLQERIRSMNLEKTFTRIINLLSF
jgi:predicted nucleotidyltransferase